MENQHSAQTVICWFNCSYFAAYANRDAFCIDNHYYSYRDLADKVGSLRLFSKKQSMETMVGLVVNDDIHTNATKLALWMEAKAMYRFTHYSP
jgi:hypothetical protein